MDNNNPRRRSKPGPGAYSLRGNAKARAVLIRKAYVEISLAKQRAALYTEVATRLGISVTTLWRWRQGNGWPPPEVLS